MGAYILVVEDEEKLARFTELELKHEGYQVDKVGDGRSALERRNIDGKEQKHG